MGCIIHGFWNSTIILPWKENIAGCSALRGCFLKDYVKHYTKYTIFSKQQIRYVTSFIEIAFFLKTKFSAKLNLI